MIVIVSLYQCLGYKLFPCGDFAGDFWTHRQTDVGRLCYFPWQLISEGALQQHGSKQDGMAMNFILLLLILPFASCVPLEGVSSTGQTVIFDFVYDAFPKNVNGISILS